MMHSKCPAERGGGGWHKASVSDCLPLAAPIGPSPLLILTLCGPQRRVRGGGGGGGGMAGRPAYAQPATVASASIHRRQQTAPNRSGNLLQSPV